MALYVILYLSLNYLGTIKHRRNKAHNIQNCLETTLKREALCAAG